MNKCSHPSIVKRPESGPGSRKPGEWFCLDCDAWWKEWRPFMAAPLSANPAKGLDR